MKEIHKKLHHYAGISTWSSENVPQLNKVIISTCSKHELWGTTTCVLESRICNINTMLAYVMIQFMKKKIFLAYLLNPTLFNDHAILHRCSLW